MLARRTSCVNDAQQSVVLRVGAAQEAQLGRGVERVGGWCAGVALAGRRSDITVWNRLSAFDHLPITITCIEPSLQCGGEKAKVMPYEVASLERPLRDLAAQGRTGVTVQSRSVRRRRYRGLAKPKRLARSNYLE